MSKGKKSNTKITNKAKEDSKATSNRAIIQTDGGFIERPVNVASKVDLDTSDYFEERSNPYSSKGN